MPAVGSFALTEGGLNTTFCRGIQFTHNEGFVQLNTVFPGHYYGRATHIHVISWANYSVLANNTIVGDVDAHIGQLYFDQTLRDTVEQLSPYTLNNKPLTTNAEGMFGPLGASAQYEPLVNYTYLSQNIQDRYISYHLVATHLKEPIL